MAGSCVQGRLHACHLQDSACNIQGETSVFLSSHGVTDHFYSWADKGICLFLLLLKPNYEAF